MDNWWWVDDTAVTLAEATSAGCDWLLTDSQSVTSCAISYISTVVEQVWAPQTYLCCVASESPVDTPGRAIGLGPSLLDDVLELWWDSIESRCAVKLGDGSGGALYCAGTSSEMPGIGALSKGERSGGLLCRVLWLSVAGGDVCEPYLGEYAELEPGCVSS